MPFERLQMFEDANDSLLLLKSVLDEVFLKWGFGVLRWMRGREVQEEVLAQCAD
jgi:hypothetical protein